MLDEAEGRHLRELEAYNLGRMKTADPRDEAKTRLIRRRNRRLKSF